MTPWIVLGVVALAVAGWLILSYNGLVSLKNQVQNAWTQIDVQLKRRHDLIPNLVNTVKGFMQFEQDTLEKVIQARNTAVGAHGVAETAQAETALTQSLGRLFALSESYPELKSSQNVLQLQEELSSTENKIAFARQFYNDLATRFNTQQEVFPTNLIATQLGFRRAELFEAEVQERQVPQVDLALQ